MGVSAKPTGAAKSKPADQLNDRKVRQFIQGGGSAATAPAAEDGVKFTLPVPGKLLTRLERHREALPVPTRRIPWILQAIAEKLERDGY